jgi:hypothetical protein
VEAASEMIMGATGGSQHEVFSYNGISTKKSKLHHRAAGRKRVALHNTRKQSITATLILCVLNGLGFSYNEPHVLF